MEPGMATDRGGYPWLGSPDTVKVWSVEPEYRNDWG